MAYSPFVQSEVKAILGFAITLFEAAYTIFHCGYSFTNFCLNIQPSPR